MTVNVEQVAATASSVAAVLAVGGGGFVWLGRWHAKTIARTAAAVAAAGIAEATATITKRIDHSDTQTAEQISELKKRAEEDRLEMARQFGGNGGGMREAINKVAESIVPVVARVENLSGRFEQHLAEGAHR